MRRNAQPGGMHSQEDTKNINKKEYINKNFFIIFACGRSLSSYSLSFVYTLFIIFIIFCQ